MGYALATAAASRGAEVTLISGKTALKPPVVGDRIRLVNVFSAEEMRQAALAAYDDTDIVFKAAAVAD